MGDISIYYGNLKRWQFLYEKGVKLQLTTKDFLIVLRGDDGHGKRALDGMDD